MQTFFFYDYETWGIDPARDWPAQFAGIRTDMDLNEIEEPINIYCRLPEDQLPTPEACLVTGLTPNVVNDRGMPEAEFIARIHTEFARPQTCVLGYNSLRFDDEVTRYSLYRNFFDPYAREWQNGCSRWDLLDVVRACAAFRPEGIEWPKREDGSVSFKLEDLTAANGIAHANAHDAVSDVRATIAMARLIKTRQPKLFAYLLEHRQKTIVAPLLDTSSSQPQCLLHVSGMFSPARHCLAPIVPVAAHPTNKNEVIVYDLAEDPAPLLELDAETVRERLYTKRQVLEESGLASIALKTIRLNRCPVVLPLSLIKDQAQQQRLGIDVELCKKHYQQLFASPEQVRQLRQKLQMVFTGKASESQVLPCDQALYSSFVPNSDKPLLERVRVATPEQLIELSLPFQDKRLAELLFLYRARNWPETLQEEERSEWVLWCQQRITEGSGGRSLPLAQYLDHLAALKAEAEGSKHELLDTLERYVSKHLEALQLQMMPAVH